MMPVDCRYPSWRLAQDREAPVSLAYEKWVAAGKPYICARAAGTPTPTTSLARPWSAINATA